jgi:hypothetical protein
VSSGLCDHGVDDEGMHPAVPGHVDKSDQLLAIEGTDPAQAVRLDLAPPVDLQDGVAESLRMEDVEVLVLEGGSPRIARRTGCALSRRSRRRSCRCSPPRDR